MTKRVQKSLNVDAPVHSRFYEMLETEKRIQQQPVMAAQNFLVTLMNEHEAKQKAVLKSLEAR